ncbi:ABC transporter permease [Actinotalea sp. C106]|uniref:ABC transporter permease n=1 Tax=Actinotalea sp. C106 TaxID=2908644 RepID=UPI002027E127|nr:ABC transporter permease [Actinotalea sp. C106]
MTATTLREVVRRPTALLLVFALPLVFYLVRLDVPWQAIRFLAIGVGWAIATLSLFSHVSSRHLDQRLAVVGASPSALFLGRQLALLGIGAVVAACYLGVVLLTQDEIPRMGGIVLLLVTTVLISAPLGALVSLIIGRELEGALALLSVMALQLLVDPEERAAGLLPLWSTRELSAYAIEDHATASLAPGLAHFAATLALCTAIGWAASVIRLTPVRLATPGERH